MSLRYVNDCRKPLKRLKYSPHQRQRDRSGTLIGKLMPFCWNQVTWSWLKPIPTGGGGKWELVGGGTIQSRMPGCRRCPFLHYEEPVDRTLTSPPQKLTFSHHFDRGDSSPYICTVVQAKWARCTNNAPEEQTPEVNETEEGPHSVNCPSLAQHQTGETPLEQVNRKLHAFMWMFSGASWLDKGWKVQCRGIGGV